MNRLIIRNDRPLHLSDEQIMEALGKGLRVSYTYKDGKNRKIKSGWLSFRRPTCDCCSPSAEFWRESDWSPPNQHGFRTRLRPETYLCIPNLHTLIGGRR